MGSYDGREKCELVHCFLLSQLQVKFEQNIGLNRDDGLDITDTSPRATEICRIFKDNGLRITIDANKQVVNFLDVTFNLTKNSYKAALHNTQHYTAVRPSRKQLPTQHYKQPRSQGLSPLLPLSLGKRPRFRLVT